jgi:glycerophosphoryl diester phosphodiesterase
VRRGWLTIGGIAPALRGGAMTIMVALSAACGSAPDAAAGGPVLAGQPQAGADAARSDASTAGASGSPSAGASGGSDAAASGAGGASADGGVDPSRVDGSAQPDAAGDDSDAGEPSSTRIRLDELQVAGTHNSYHVASALPLHPSHQYTHRPLAEQLEGGVRALELDVHARSDGQLDVYHIELIDPLSTCALFIDCLAAIEQWSSANPRHTPIFVWLEIKDDTGGQPITDLLPVEAAIRAVFSEAQLITPVSLRGAHATLRERIDAQGWPLLDEVRGRVMFVVLNRNDERVRAYSHDYSHLDDRLMFANATAEQFALPWAVITKLEGDLTQAAIAEAHAGSMLTATNVCAIDSDDATCAQRNADAVAAGLHMLKDDLPFTIAGRGYVLELPMGSPGCNPVTATAECDAALLE